MALSLQEISDRIEIEDLLQRYTAAIDAKDWELLATVFTPDATLDYTSSGGAGGSVPRGARLARTCPRAVPHDPPHDREVDRRARR